MLVNVPFCDRVSRSFFDRICRVGSRIGPAVESLSLEWNAFSFVSKPIPADVITNFDIGGVVSYDFAKSELVSFMDRDETFDTLLWEDPWMEPGDLDVGGPGVGELIYHERCAYLLMKKHSAGAVKQFLIANNAMLSMDKVIFCFKGAGKRIIYEPDEYSYCIVQVVISGYDGEGFVVFRPKMI